MPVRAKFRCLSATHTWKDEFSAKLAPVISKGDSYPGGSQENREFWEASPSGECELWFRNLAASLVKVKSYYYIDMRRLGQDPDEKTAEENLWTLTSVKYLGNSHDKGPTMMEVELTRSCWHESPFFSGTLKIGIHNKAAWPHFENRVGTPWEVIFTEADAGNTGCPYTD